jgi:hypothetical protein
MHDTTFKRYIDSDRDVWQIRCTECGLVAEGIGSEELAGFLAGLHRGIDSGPPCTTELVGTTHVLDGDTGDMLCGAKNQWSNNESVPDLATCLPCWKAWHLRAGTLPKDPTGLPRGRRLRPAPYRRRPAPPKGDGQRL